MRARQRPPPPSSPLYRSHLVPRVPHSSKLLRERVETVPRDKPRRLDTVLGEQLEQARHADLAREEALSVSLAQVGGHTREMSAGESSPPYEPSLGSVGPVGRLTSQRLRRRRHRIWRHQGDKGFGDLRYEDTAHGVCVYVLVYEGVVHASHPHAAASYTSPSPSMSCLGALVVAKSPRSRCLASVSSPDAYRGQCGRNPLRYEARGMCRTTGDRMVTPTAVLLSQIDLLRSLSGPQCVGDVTRSTRFVQCQVQTRYPCLRGGARCDPRPCRATTAINTTTTCHHHLATEPRARP